jgi:hypothetical protein
MDQFEHYEGAREPDGLGAAFPYASQFLSNAVLDVLLERRLQDEKWGEQNHHRFYWFAILSEEVGEAGKALVECKPLSEFRLELVQVAAVAIAAIESIDRNVAVGLE